MGWIGGQRPIFQDLTRIGELDERRTFLQVARPLELKETNFAQNLQRSRTIQKEFTVEPAFPENKAGPSLVERAQDDDDHNYTCARLA